MEQPELETDGYSKGNWKPYPYSPSFEAAIVFVALFGLATIYLIYQVLKALSRNETNKRDKRFLWMMVPFILGGSLETFGYTARVVLSFDITNIRPYIAQKLLLLFASPLYAVTLYMSLGSLVELLECQKISFMPIKLLIMIFVIGDLFSFLVQLAGGVIVASGTIRTGQYIINSGLIVQTLFLGLFMIVALTFYHRAVKYPNEYIMIMRNIPSQFNNWNSIFIAILACSTLLLTRCISRLIEAVQGERGYLISHEIFLYSLDASLMFINMIVFMSQDIGKYCLIFQTYLPYVDRSEDLNTTIVHKNYLFY
ncbi:DEHA2D11506p [Debaryomyces hansenii CBS767]|uniref:DEHA2D11506p n=1 Tax=Debaryomyces hansenii (strain ATCC 36239 / CBS 767 / BCRC 21394 / JCM 1990 / NBRC 0083 / IGC 2968) TaxID=284592 RepID=Q6BS53_DEBHA|nr:DEHA2D11506p [Debaryomyces hansenii CBS767]CAG87128.2 DEHA2D11506p [Debaryomyces hansenii CBS767]|eukprot:XP_458967.2 DEHA2D11506p [Debaryomyces hansenii CBS767]